MSRLTGRGYSAQDAADFETRSQEAYTWQWKAEVRRFQGGEDVVLAEELPIVTGRLSLDSSAAVRRRLDLEVAGTIPVDEDSTLVPFGQRIILSVRIDRADGSWFPWLEMGHYAISEVVVERPSGIHKVQGHDLSGTVEELRFLTNRSFKGQNVKQAVEACVSAALPDSIYSVAADDTSRERSFTNYVANAGNTRWAVALDIAQRKGCETFFDANNTLIIRRDRTQDDEDTIPAVGPDIGTVNNPVARLVDGEGGNLSAVTSTVTRNGGVNGVRINVLASKQGKDDDIDYHVEELQETGPAAWGNKFGRIPLVLSRNVAKVTADIRQDVNKEAKDLLRRRLGVVRYLDATIAPQLWLEPDDTVAITWAGRTEFHFVQKVEIRFGGGASMQITTRQLSTTVTTPGSFL